MLQILVQGVYVTKYKDTTEIMQHKRHSTDAGTDRPRVTKSQSWQGGELDFPVKQLASRKTSEASPCDKGDVPVYAQFMKYAPSYPKPTLVGDSL